MTASHLKLAALGRSLAASFSLIHEEVAALRVKLAAGGDVDFGDLERRIQQARPLTEEDRAVARVFTFLMNPPGPFIDFMFRRKTASLLLWGDGACIEAALGLHDLASVGFGAEGEVLVRARAGGAGERAAGGARPPGAPDHGERRGRHGDRAEDHAPRGCGAAIRGGTGRGGTGRSDRGGGRGDRGGRGGRAPKRPETEHGRRDRPQAALAPLDVLAELAKFEEGLAHFGAVFGDSAADAADAASAELTKFAAGRAPNGAVFDGGAAAPADAASAELAEFEAAFGGGEAAAGGPKSWGDS